MIEYDFAVYSLGCKVNAYEGRAMASKLAANGYNVAEGLVTADCYIINTCSVTGEADRKSRQTVSRILKLNPDAKIYVCGCSSQNDAVRFAGKTNVRIIGGAGAKTELIDEILADLNGRETDKISVKALPPRFESNLTPSVTRTRGFIKVQDGCDNFCSYCIIPHLRGRSRSGSIENIVNQARETALCTKEIVVAGINLSAYGKDNGSSLLSLVRALGAVNVRKRFGSLECEVIDEEFINAAKDNGFCDHYHLSLQSGSDTVLKRMNRRYTAAQFLSKVELIRKICPDAGITTDIIAGFCGETDAEFNETAAFMRRARFSDAHIFAYSERKGTVAYNMAQVDKSIREQRAAELAKIKDGLKDAFTAENLNKTAEVYFEEAHGDDNLCAGYTSNYIKVYAGAAPGALINVRLSEKYADGIKGEPV